MTARRPFAGGLLLALGVLGTASAMSVAATGRHVPARACRASTHRSCRVPRHSSRHVARHRAPRSTGAGAGAHPPAAKPPASGGPALGAAAPATPISAATASPPTAAPAPAAPAHLQVTGKEFSFTLSRPTVVAGPVIVQFVNAGQDPHDLHIRSAAGDDVGAFPVAAPGTHTSPSFALSAGSYTLYCSLPGHEAKGMRATLIVD